MLKYDEALEIIEKFNIDSGLRDFCTNRCEGTCCSRCKDTCIKRNERRIACSTFFCGPVLKIIFPDNKERSAYKHIQSRMRSHIGKYINANPIFYKHPSDEEMANIQMSEFPETMREIKALDVKKIQEIVDNITDKQLYYLRNHEKVVRAKMEEKRKLSEERHKKTKG